MLAIIVPYYKLTFFEATLQSLANQTDTKFRVYIGDDASPEDPSILLGKYKNSFDFVYQRFDTNLGGTSLTQQWERCIALSNDEEWLMILGDDDVLASNVVEEFYKHNSQIIELDINVVRFATQKIQEGLGISEIFIHPRIEKATDFLFRKTRSSLSEYVFRKQKILEIGFKDFPLGWFSDILAVLEFSNFQKIYTINDAIIYPRISGLSISGNQTNSKSKFQAAFNYYHYLITEKKEYFNLSQREKLLFSLGKSYINNKKEVGNFFKISKVYLSCFLFKEYLQFIQSIFKSYLKKNANRI